MRTQDLTSLANLSTVGTLTSGTWNASIIGVPYGGTGWAAIQSGAIPYGSGSSALATTTAGTAGQVLALLNGVPTWAATTTLSSISGTLSVAQGGTASTTLGGILTGNGTGAVTSAVVSSPLSFSGTTLSISQASGSQNGYIASADWTLFNNKISSSSLSSIFPFSPTTNFGQVANATSTAIWLQGSPFSLFASSTAAFSNASTTAFTNTGSTWLTALSSGGLGVDANGKIYSGATSTLATITGSLNLASQVSGVLPVGNGGTGWANINAGYIPFGNAGSALSTSTSLFFDNTNARLGIGTTTPWAQLSINPNGINSTAEFAIGSSTQTHFLVTTNGTVAIGTSSPVSGAKLDVFGNLFLDGQSNYVNFGTTTGANGYGLWDNNGTLNFKNANGSWQGVTTATSGPTFLVNKNGSSQTVSANTPTKVTWASPAVFDTNNNFDFTNNRFKPTVPGKYVVSAAIHCQVSAAGTCDAFIYKDGGAIQQVRSIPTASGDATAVATAIVDMNGSTDYLEAYGQTTATTIYGGSTLTTFTGAMIAPVNATAGGWQFDGSESILADNTKKVGIGTSTPYSKLTVWGADTAASTQSFLVANSASTTLFQVNDDGSAYHAGKLGIGTTTNLTSLLTAYQSSNSNYAATFRNGGGSGPGLQIQSGSSAGAGNALSVETFDGATSRFVVTNSGNVGIGTTSPSGTLALAGAAATVGLYVRGGGNAGVNIADFGDVNGGGRVVINPSGLVYVGTNGVNPDATHAGVRLSSPDNSANISATTLTSSITHWIFYNGNGVVGSIQTNGSATSFNTSSDRRIKENIATTTMGLDQLMQIPVRDFAFKSDPTHATTTGFIAQELESIFPWAVTTNGDNGVVSLGATSTPWSVDYGRLTPLLVQAIQDLNLKVESLATSAATSTDTTSFPSRFFASLFVRITTWLGDAGNGIGNLFAATITANVGNFHQVIADELCARGSASDPSPVCVTKTQLAALLSAGATPTTAISVSSSASTSRDVSFQNPSSTSSISVSSSSPAGIPPTIQINGANPAVIHVGDTYQDLGATITGPTDADKNLGLRSFLNGTLVSDIVIDTSTVATDTIDYVMTDPAGLTSTSTRTVIIEPVVPSFAPPSSASSTPAAIASSSPVTVASSTAQ